MRSRRRPRTPFLPLLLALVASACGSDSEASGRETEAAREALVRYNAALRQKQPDEAQRWVLHGEDQTSAFRMIYEISDVLDRLRSGVVARFGEEGLALLRQEPGAALAVMEPYRSDAELAATTIQLHGEEALAIFPDGSRSRLARAHEQWHVDMIGSSDPADVRAVLADVRFKREAVVAALERMLPRLQDEGLTAQGFDLALGAVLEQTEAAYRERLEAEAQAAGAASPGPPAPGRQR